MTRHPAILHIGKVTNRGDTVTVYGWGLNLCEAACSCHRDPTGRMALYEDDAHGYLGLIHHNPPDCGCCEPWTADELAAIVRDHTILKELETTTS